MDEDKVEPAAEAKPEEHEPVACEWHRGYACKPDALCMASRDGFCDAMGEAR